MSQVVASQPYCLENSLHLTRPGSDGFYKIDGHDGPTIVDKRQAKRLYRLQRSPYVKTSLHLEPSEELLNESSILPSKKVYHRPIDMSDASMARFSFGKSRLDPQRMIPSQLTSARNHPAVNTTLRYSDRTVPDQVIRARIGPGGSINANETAKKTEDYLQNGGRLPTQAPFRKQPRSAIDDLARHYMYTSTQQAAFDEVAWDSKLPTKLPAPLTTYEENGSDQLLVSKSLPSFYDGRGYDILDWDRVQPRKDYFIRKPFMNVAPLPRAQQISGYSGCIGGKQIENIDNPTIDFKPYTIVRSDQPKRPLSPFKANMPSYTGKTHWTKIDPVSHQDEFGHAYTTTSSVHKPLPFDVSTPRFVNLHGPLSRIVTTVYPQNPFNQIENTSNTVNTSLDSRSHFALRQLPRTSFPRSPRAIEQPAAPSD